MVVRIWPLQLKILQMAARQLRPWSDATFLTLRVMDVNKPDCIYLFLILATNSFVI